MQDFWQYNLSLSRQIGIHVFIHDDILITLNVQLLVNGALQLPELRFMVLYVIYWHIHSMMQNLQTQR